MWEGKNGYSGYDLIVAMELMFTSNIWYCLHRFISILKFFSAVNIVVKSQILKLEISQYQKVTFFVFKHYSSLPACTEKFTK
jgi:hypothetical protein